MAKKKEKKVKVVKEKPVEAVVNQVTVEIPIEEVVVVKAPIAPLSVDYNNEGLNNIARKINEIIEDKNG